MFLDSQISYWWSCMAGRIVYQQAKATPPPLRSSNIITRHNENKVVIRWNRAGACMQIRVRETERGVALSAAAGLPCLTTVHSQPK